MNFFNMQILNPNDQRFRSLRTSTSTEEILIVHCLAGGAPYLLLGFPGIASWLAGLLAKENASGWLFAIHWISDVPPA
jgi:hypothetical protein